MISANDLFYELRRRIPTLRHDYRPSTSEALRSEGLSDLYEWILAGLAFRPMSEPLHILDIGAQDFRYASGLARWAKKLSSHHEISIEALEIDPFQLYFDLFRRGDIAEFYAREATALYQVDVTYRQANWLEEKVTRRPDLITCFFPFLYKDLSRRFGLPRRAHKPEDFYQKILETAKWGGVFFHQGSAEAEESLKLLSSLGAKICEIRIIHQNPYLARKHSIEVIRWSSQEP